MTQAIALFATIRFSRLFSGVQPYQSWPEIVVITRQSETTIKQLLARLTESTSTIKRDCRRYAGSSITGNLSEWSRCVTIAWKFWSSVKRRKVLLKQVKLRTLKKISLRQCMIDTIIRRWMSEIRSVGLSGKRRLQGVGRPGCWTQRRSKDHSFTMQNW